MNDLLKEMNERLKYLESIEQTDENKARIKEITLAIVRVQQILLDELTNSSHFKGLAEELKRKAIETYLKYGDNKALVIKGKRTYTGNEIAHEIVNETDLGIDIVNKIMQLSIDLLKRDKINLPEQKTIVEGYWEQRCLLAERLLKETTSEFDITAHEFVAYKAWTNFIQAYDPKSM